MGMSTLVLCDLEKPQREKRQPCEDGVRIYYGSERAARCKGCFGCWLKSPGECVMGDGLKRLGSEMAASERIIVISRNLYGGFSVEVKRMLDRALSCFLPYFEVRDGRLHHQLRGQTFPHMSVYFYETENMTAAEKDLSKQVVKANSINYNAVSYEIYFIEGKISVEEVLALEHGHAEL